MSRSPASGNFGRAADACYLPRWLRTETGPPRPAIYFQCGLALLLLWTATFDGLLTYLGFTLGLSTAATVLGLVRLRRREGANLRVPGWPWVPVLFLLSVLGMTIFSIAPARRESARLGHDRNWMARLADEPGSAIESGWNIAGQFPPPA